jgi:hypothetical protein
MSHFTPGGRNSPGRALAFLPAGAACEKVAPLDYRLATGATDAFCDTILDAVRPGHHRLGAGATQRACQEWNSGWWDSGQWNSGSVAEQLRHAR